MSKTTKIIAALGVVAGLGVAALPAFTFAETVTGDVDVIVEVEPAIAMTIAGNNDDNSHEGTAATYTAVQEPTGNPSLQNYYERSGEGPNYTYALTTDKTVDTEKTYYQVSTVGTYQPVDAFAPSDIAGGTLDGHSIPGTSITGTSSSYASLSPSSKILGDSSNGFRSTITVYTNATSGYTLTLKDADTDNSLKQDGSGEVPTIAAVSSQGIVEGVSAWGYRVSSQHGTPVTPGDWLAVPISTDTAANISSQDSKTTNGDQTIVDYAVSTSGDQATGIYHDVITYTATAI